MRDVRKYYELVDRRHQQQTIVTDVKPDISELKMPCYLFLDQASHTGYTLWDEDSRLVLSGVMYRENNTENFETFIHEMVSVIEDLCVDYGVTRLFYEEVYVPKEVSVSTAETLHYIKHHITDIGFRNKNVEVLGLDASRWKQELAKPQAFKRNKDEKKQVMKFVEEIFPLLSFTTNDESDALGMGISVMIKDRNKKNIYNVTRYNKKLPIHLEIFNNDRNYKDPAIIDKLPVRFKRPYNIGGLYELPLNKRKGLDSEVRKYLSHKDSLLYVEIPRDYKDWGILLLTNNISIHDLTSEDKSYIVLASRKKRL